MKNKPKFRIVGHGELDLNPKPNAVIKVVEFLSKTKRGDLYFFSDLCKNTGVSESHLGGFTKHPDLVKLKRKFGKLHYWGSEQTINDLKESE